MCVEKYNLAQILQQGFRGILVFRKTLVGLRVF